MSTLQKFSLDRDSDDGQERKPCQVPERRDGDGIRAVCHGVRFLHQPVAADFFFWHQTVVVLADGPLEGAIARDDDAG